MGSLEKRVGRLEALVGEAPTPPARPSLVKHVLETIRIHKWGRSVYPATDHELNIMGMLEAGNHFSGASGEYTFPSGATITFTEAGSAYITGRVEVEDLGEGLREYVERMEPAKQAERLRRLYELLEQGQDGA
jgi:hypothetical protein